MNNNILLLYICIVPTGDTYKWPRFGQRNVTLELVAAWRYGGKIAANMIRREVIKQCFK